MTKPIEACAGRPSSVEQPRARNLLDDRRRRPAGVQARVLVPDRRQPVGRDRRRQRRRRSRSRSSGRRRWRRGRDRPPRRARAITSADRRGAVRAAARRGARAAPRRSPSRSPAGRVSLPGSRPRTPRSRRAACEASSQRIYRAPAWVTSTLRARDVAQPGSAPALGAGGREFESRRPDSGEAERAIEFGSPLPDDSRVVVRACVVFAVVVSAFVVAGGSASAPSPSGTIVAYRDDAQAGFGALYLLGAGGDGPRRLTAAWMYSQPGWSPDGRWIVFLLPQRNATLTGVFEIRRDGSGLRRLGLGVPVNEARWSPRGDWVGYDGCGGVCLVNPGTGERGSVGGVQDVRGWSWSPDGRQIVFAHGDAELTLVDVGSGAKRVLQVKSASHGVPQKLGFPEWSPRANTIACIDWATERLELVLSAGGTARPIGAGRGNTYAWSPDGARLAHWDGYSMYVYSVATHRDVRVSDPARATTGRPAWSPDGRWLAYVRKRRVGDSHPGTDLWLVHPDGSDPHPITHAGGGVRYLSPAWTAR